MEVHLKGAACASTATLIFFRTDEMIASKAGYGLAELPNVVRSKGLAKLNDEPGVHMQEDCAHTSLHLHTIWVLRQSPVLCNTCTPYHFFAKHNLIHLHTLHYLIHLHTLHYLRCIRCKGVKVYQVVQRVEVCSRAACGGAHPPVVRMQLHNLILPLQLLSCAPLVPLVKRRLA